MEGLLLSYRSSTPSEELGCHLHKATQSPKRANPLPSHWCLDLSNKHITHITNVIHFDDISQSLQLTFDVALQIVVFHKCHISEALPTGVSNQAPKVKDMLKPAKLHGLHYDTLTMRDILLCTILFELCGIAIPHLNAPILP